MAKTGMTQIEDDEFEPTEVDGAYVEKEGDDIVVDFEGGGRERPESDGEFDENLAGLMDKDERIKLGTSLVDMVRADKESRDQWETRILDGLEIIGVQEIPREAAAFDGASTVNHPGIAEAMVRFQANAMEELFPAEGPVKTKVVGKSTPEKEERSQRVQEFMNFQLTEQDDEYFEHTDQMTMYLPYAGSAFKKVYYDRTDEAAISRFVDAQHFIVPYDATSLAKSPRYTHWYEITGNDLNARIESGEFIEPEGLDPKGSSRVEDEGRELKDRSDKRQESRDTDDVVYDLYEVHIETVLDFDENDGSDDFPVPLPYVITVEKDSGEILAIRRLWREDDPKRRKRVQFIHYKFLPGLGFYGWGYLHIIGSLGKSASGALRALLDGSATASLQGGFKSKESKIAGEFVFTPGVWKDVDMTAEDLAKSFYTPPFKEPSPALFKTLELLTMGIQNFSSTTEAMTGAADNKGPVGTTLALIEQGSKIYSGIHKRMHKAARFEFKMLAELDFEYLDDEYPYDVYGASRDVFKDDFDPNVVDILPVSDPNIYSNVQRVAQAQAGMELVGSDPELYDDEAKREAHMDMWKALRIPSPERFLPKKVVKRVDPVTENQTMLTGGAAKAFAEQDHEAHMKAHEMFAMEVMGMGLEPQIAEAALINIQAHITEHYAHAYRLRMEQELGTQLPDTDFTDQRDDEDVPIEIDHAIARAIAANVSPPPPPQGPEPSDEERRQAEHDQKIAHKDEEHQQRMRHAEESHGQDLQQSDEAADQDMRKKAANNLLDDAARAAKLQE